MLAYMMNLERLAGYLLAMKYIWTLRAFIFQYMFIIKAFDTQIC